MKEAIVFLEYILESINNIESFSNKLSKEKFLKTRLKQSAIIREFEIVGEAVKNIDEAFRKKYPEIEWKKIAGLRDKLTHHYFGVNLERVWIIIKDDLPILKKEIEKILKEEREDEI